MDTYITSSLLRIIMQLAWLPGESFAPSSKATMEQEKRAIESTKLYYPCS